MSVGETATAFINHMSADGLPFVAAWGREMAQANKYDLGPFDEVEWLDDTLLLEMVSEEPGIFDVPGGNVLAMFSKDGFAFLIHMFKKHERVRYRVAMCALEGEEERYAGAQLWVDYRDNRHWLTTWFFSSDDDLGSDLVARYSFMYPMCADVTSLIGDLVATGELPANNANVVEIRRQGTTVTAEQIAIALGVSVEEVEARAGREGWRPAGRYLYAVNTQPHLSQKGA